MEDFFLELLPRVQNRTTVTVAGKPRPELWGASKKCNHGFLNAKFFELPGENASAPRNLQDFESAVLRGARRTLRTAHPITRSLSDAASNFASLPALHSTEAAFCRLRAPRSVYSDSSSAPGRRFFL